MEKIKILLKRYWLTLAGGIAGAIGGFAYWFYIGCASGTCAITSSPINSTIYGIIMGALLFNMFNKEKKK